MKILSAFCAFLFSISAIHAAEKVGAWEVILAPADDYQVAKTTNGAGGIAGVLCFVSSNSCNAYFVADVGCDEGAKYPILMSWVAGSMATQASCVRYGQNKLLVLENKPAVIDAFEDGGEVAFVLPMKDNKFIVTRFNSVGAKTAIRKATTLPAVRQAPKTPLPQAPGVV